jgi:hypothetical protein
VESLETFEEAYFEVKRHDEQADEQRAQNGDSLQDLAAKSAQVSFHIAHCTTALLGKERNVTKNVFARRIRTRRRDWNFFDVETASDVAVEARE